MKFYCPFEVHLRGCGEGREGSGFPEPSENLGFFFCLFFFSIFLFSA